MGSLVHLQAAFSPKSPHSQLDGSAQKAILYCQRQLRAPSAAQPPTSATHDASKKKWLLSPHRRQHSNSLERSADSCSSHDTTAPTAKPTRRHRPKMDGPYLIYFRAPAAMTASASAPWNSSTTLASNASTASASIRCSSAVSSASPRTDEHSGTAPKRTAQLQCK